MNLKTLIRGIILTLFAASTAVFPQNSSSGVPFLSASLSSEANGMGGIMSSVPSLSPSAILFNPGQLGYLSKTTLASAEFYTQKPYWNGSFLREVSTLQTYSVLFGYQFSTVSIGMAYSRIYLDMGSLTLTSWRNPADTKSIHYYDAADNFSFGIGFRFGVVDGGFGVTLKQVTSQMGGNNSSGSLSEVIAKPIAADIGILLKIPLFDLLGVSNYFSGNSLKPYGDLHFGYAMNNFGENVYYEDASQSDPLPRTARLGWSTELGYRYSNEHLSLTIASMLIAREAEEYLFGRNKNGVVHYKYLPIGEMNIFSSLIEGKYVLDTGVRKGFAFSFLETVTFRSGSYHYYGGLTNGTDGIAKWTDGITVSTTGLFKFLHSLSREGQPSTASFINRVEIRYNHSQFSGSESKYWGSDFNSLSIAIKH